MSDSVQPEYAAYATPVALADSANISKAEKIRILKIWLEDEDQLCRAAAEGMTGGPQHNLKAVQRALDGLL